MSNPKNIKPGEIWTFTDSANQTRLALILGVFEDEYANYVILHPYKKKSSANLEITTRRGPYYVDPRKLSFTHLDTFNSMMLNAVPASVMAGVRERLAKHLGFDPNAPAELEQQLMSAMASVASMKEKIKEQQHQLAVYKELCECGLLALVEKLCGVQGEKGEQAAPEQLTVEPEEKPLTQLERNRAKYAHVQAYIGVKCKAVGISLATLDKLTGHVQKNGKPSGAVSRWVRGGQCSTLAGTGKDFPRTESRGRGVGKAE